MPFLKPIDIESAAVINAYKQLPMEYYSRPRAWYQWMVVHFFICPYLWIKYRPIVRGKKNLLRKSPFLVVSNHISMLDIILLNYSLDVPVAYMAKKELYKHPLAAWFFKSQGTFAVDREQPDRMTLKTALNILRSNQGWNLVIFPEGTRSLDGKLLPFKPGFASLAQKTHVPVQPVTIYKDSNGRINVAIAPPILDTTNPELVSEQAFQAIQSQLPSFSSSMIAGRPSP